MRVPLGAVKLCTSKCLGSIIFPGCEDTGRMSERFPRLCAARTTHRMAAGATMSSGHLSSPAVARRRTADTSWESPVSAFYLPKSHNEPTVRFRTTASLPLTSEAPLLLDERLAERAQWPFLPTKWT